MANHESAPVIMHEHLWCHKHLSPLQADWPRGYAFAQIRLFQSAASDERIAAECPNGNMGELQAAFNRHKPLCCYLPEGVAEEIIRQSLEGHPYWNSNWAPEMHSTGKVPDYNDTTMIRPEEDASD